MANAEIDKLIRKRGVIKGNLTRFKTFLDTLNKDQPDLLQLEVRLRKLDSYWQSFSDIQTEIELLDSTERQNIERQNFEKEYFDYEAKAYQLLKTSASPIMANTEGASARVSSGEPNFKLPEINLPIFDGSYNNWLSFKDSFESMIHKNSSISEIQKFHYLRSCLKGEVTNIIQSLQVSADNYKTAWQLISERYENKKLLINNHVTGLFNLPSVSRESHVNIRSLLDKLNNHLRALSVLEQPTNHWDLLIIHIVTSKLDSVTRREWESKHNDTDDNKLPTLDDLLKFLKKKSSLLETLSNTTEQCAKTKSFVVYDNNNNRCTFCNNNHNINKCPILSKLSPEKRYAEIKEKRLCSNCLHTGHKNKNCLSQSLCKICSKRHHTLLHFNNNPKLNESCSSSNASNNTNEQNNAERKVNEVNKSSNNGTVSVNVNTVNATTNEEQTITKTHFNNSGTQTLLCTAIIKVQDKFGNYHSCRAVLDSASESHFCTQKLADMLELNKSRVNIAVSGINKLSSQITHCTNIKIKSNTNNFQANITCLIVPDITDNLPSISFEINTLNIPTDIDLADPTFNESGKVDVLIGANLFWRLIKTGQIFLGKPGPILQNTVMGWVVSGEYVHNKIKQNTVRCNFISTSDLDNTLTKFWELEEKVIDLPLSPEEQAIENYFRDTTCRGTDGKFIVRIPLTQSPTVLGESKNIALKRLFSIETKLRKDANLNEQYVKFMTEYINLGHMSKVTNQNTGERVFIPHHFVKKDNSLTTQLRVVFDASCKTSSGVSLNDIMMVGGKLQPNLVPIIIRFRTYKWVITGDVSKMYRQVWIHPEDRKLQCILWRNKASDSVETYELNTVTYGTASAPFLAVRCLNEIAFQNSKDYPDASNKILNDFYVDDILTGSDDVETLLKLYRDIYHILNSCGFKLNKWVSNNPNVLKFILNSDPNAIVNIGKNHETHSLGLLWKSNTDILTYSVHGNKTTNVSTKRELLSSIAQIFDPLGLVGPVVIVAKIIMQRIWQQKIEWDEPLHETIINDWKVYSKNLESLNEIQIPRFVSCNNSIQVQLHGFSDASQSAYGCCIYVRTVDKSGNTYVSLLCAKSRVAPLKCVTMPRLELCAALLLAQLFDTVQRSLSHIQINDIHLWSDSTIVLAWIKAIPTNYKIFVANRIAEIQSLTRPENWHYVKSQENPADIISRGLNPQELKNNNLWWHGPTWLGQDPSYWPIRVEFDVNANYDDMEQKKPSVISTVTMVNQLNIFERFSTFARLQRVTAYILRFKNNTLVKTPKQFGMLTTTELEVAVTTLVTLVQQVSFSRELIDLKTKGKVDNKSNLLNLNPFIDNVGIIRVGGRIRYSQFPDSKKFPIVLPEKHLFSNLLIEHEHRRLLHAGPQSVLYSLRERYWIICGRKLVRKILHNCISCLRAKPKLNVEYLMADLPSKRVTPCRPFSNCGVDYCGPFNLRDRKTRKFKVTKAYICVIICFVTKAAHLELVSELSSDAFLACFHRFSSRRGKPLHIHSDNGTNFVGASAELKKFLVSTENEILRKMGQEGINWHFVPPKSPHFGGLWEAGVKSVKYHIKRVIGQMNLTYEEFNTVLVQVEACLNSRPMYPLSSDPTDLQPLTPGHFLIGQPLTSIPERDLSEVRECQLSRYKRCQKLVQDIWRRWAREYVSELQIRSKWKKNISELLTVNALVLVKEDKAPVMMWTLGRVIQLHPGNDRLVRVVTVKTVSGIYKRPVSKLCVLPISSA